MCREEQIQIPETAYEKAFYGKTTYCGKAVSWMEHEARRRGVHIHHQICGHGGERVFGERVFAGYPWVIFAWKHGYGLAAILRHWKGCPKWYPKHLVAFVKNKQGKGKLTRDLQHAQTVYLFIVYDFEALLGANEHLQATKDLRF